MNMLKLDVETFINNSEEYVKVSLSGIYDYSDMPMNIIDTKGNATGLLSSIENTYDPNFVVMSNQTPKEWLFDGKSFFLSRVSKMIRPLSNKKCILLWLCNGTDKVKVMSDSDCYQVKYQYINQYRYWTKMELPFIAFEILELMDHKEIIVPAILDRVSWITCSNHINDAYKRLMEMYKKV